MRAIACRDATATDAEALSVLGTRTFVETFGHLYRPADLAAFLENHSVAAWREVLADPEVRVRLVESGGEAVGYATVAATRLPYAPPSGAAELRQLYVLKRWHGAGVAAALMDWAIGEARRRGASAMYLSVYTDNHRARRFYDRYGFTFVGPYAFMVGEQADEDLVMRLELA